MNKLIVISLMALIACSNALAKTVSVTSVGKGDTIEAANINAYDKARFKAMAFEPSVVYTWMKGNNDRAKTKVVQIPAQITRVSVTSTEAEVLLPNEVNEPVVAIIGGVATDTSLDQYGNPDGTEYRVKTTFEFELKKAVEIDRAKNIGELQALRDIVSGKAMNDNATFIGEGYGQISDQLVALQDNMLRKNADSIKSIVDFEDIHRDVLYFKDNLLAAIAKTYPEPSVENISGQVKGNRYEALISIDLGRGCVIGGDDNPVGSLCDLWAQLPNQVADAIKTNGLLNGVNVGNTALASQARVELFVQNPLFFVDSPIDKPPYIGLMFRDPSYTSPQSYYPFSSHLSKEAMNGGLQQIALPTSRAKDVAPIGHEKILERYGVNIPAPNENVVPGVTDGYSNVVLPDFFATAIVGKSPVTLTVFNLKSREYINIPLTSDRFLLTSNLDLQWSMPWEGSEYKANDLELVVWWGNQPVQVGWKNVGGEMTFPSLTHYSDSKTQMKLLALYRENINVFSSQSAYKNQRQLPTSPGAFAALANACLNNGMDMMVIPCAYRVPSVMKTVVAVGVDTPEKLSGLGDVVALSSNPMIQKECWMYAPSKHEMVTCKEAAELSRGSWWMELGEYPMTDRVHRKTGGLWGDLKERTFPALVGDKLGRGVVKGEATKTPTDPSLVW
jgi:hypothetical protein